LDDVLFTPNTECLLIAHNLDAGKAIFDKKIELAWKNVRPEIRSLYKVDANSAQTLKFEYGDGTFSSIAVDTNGRSGTYNRVHITEFADVCKKFPNKVKDILEGTIPAVPTEGRGDIESTSQGASGEFYEMFMQAWERGEPKYPVEYKAHFYNWQWDEEIDLIIPEPNLPDKFKEYQKLNKLSDKEISYYYQKWLSLNQSWNSLHKEYPTTPEEAFEIIVEGSYYGEEIGRMEREGRIGIVSHDRALKVHTVWDLGIGSNLRIGFYQRTREGQLRRIDHWFGQGSDGMPEAIAIVLKKPYVYGSHFGPHDLEATDISTGKSRRETAKNLGISFKLVPDIHIDDGINAGQVMLSQLWVDKENNKEWIKSMKNYCREWDDKRGSYKDIPYHNWACFTGDTKVLTHNGIYPIMEVASNGEVLTKNGWKKYNNLGITGENAPLVEVVFNDNTKVRCTPEHLFLTENGWKSADKLEKGSVIQSSLTLSRSIGMAGYIVYGQMKTIFQEVVNICIDWFGKMPLVKFLKVVTFTIKIVIQKTTNYPILNVLTQKNIYLLNGINENPTLKSIFHPKPDNEPQNGINQKQADYGIVDLLNECKDGKNGRENQENVYGVKNLLTVLLEIVVILKSSVIQIVKPLTIATINKLERTANVYDLNVPNEECFSLVNGAIVHNSHDADEWRYASLVADKMTNDTQILNRPFYDKMDEIWEGEPKSVERYDG